MGELRLNRIGRGGGGREKRIVRSASFNVEYEYRIFISDEGRIAVFRSLLLSHSTKREIVAFKE